MATTFVFCKSCNKQIELSDLAQHVHEKHYVVFIPNSGKYEFREDYKLPEVQCSTIDSEIMDITSEHEPCKQSSKQLPSFRKPMCSFCCDCKVHFFDESSSLHLGHKTVSVVSNNSTHISSDLSADEQFHKVSTDIEQYIGVFDTKEFVVSNLESFKQTNDEIAHEASSILESIIPSCSSKILVHNLRRALSILSGFNVQNDVDSLKLLLKNNKHKLYTSLYPKAKHAESSVRTDFLSTLEEINYFGISLVEKQIIKEINNFIQALMTRGESIKVIQTLSSTVPTILVISTIGTEYRTYFSNSLSNGHIAKELAFEQSILTSDECDCFTMLYLMHHIETSTHLMFHRCDYEGKLTFPVINDSKIDSLLYVDDDDSLNVASAELKFNGTSHRRTWGACEKLKDGAYDVLKVKRDCLLLNSTSDYSRLYYYVKSKSGSGNKYMFLTTDGRVVTVDTGNMRITVEKKHNNNKPKNNESYNPNSTAAVRTYKIQDIFDGTCLDEYDDFVNKKRIIMKEFYLAPSERIPNDIVMVVSSNDEIYRRISPQLYDKCLESTSLLKNKNLLNEPWEFIKYGRINRMFVSKNYIFDDHYGKLIPKQSDCIIKLSFHGLIFKQPYDLIDGKMQVVKY